MSLTFEEAVDFQNRYKPTDETTLKELGTITLAPIVGPTAVGKNHAMAQLTKDRGYYQAGNLISRERRANDPPNVLHKDIPELLQLIEEGKLVQFAAIKGIGTSALYATGLENYQPGMVNTKDIFAHSIEGFTGYGFKHLRPVCIVVSPEKWEPRLDQRFKSLDDNQIQTRLEEAEQSIEWILEGSPEIRRVVTIGDDEHNKENTERIEAFVENNQDVPLEQAHYDIADLMKQSLPRLRKKYIGDK